MVGIDHEDRVGHAGNVSCILLALPSRGICLSGHLHVKNYTSRITVMYFDYVLDLTWVVLLYAGVGALALFMIVRELLRRKRREPRR
jgi:hypothetical protein